MTTGSLKKRLNAAAMVGCPSREQYRVNKKKVRLQRYDPIMRPNISLEWDDKKKCVVSKRDQIALARRQLIPFIEADTYGHSALADVLSVPEEIFDLDNLSDVLSYEVWQSHLSHRERILLSRFLPKDLNLDAILHALLAGDNFHFGNPFLKWSSSLCLGKLHPDNIVNEEHSRKALRKSYYITLHKYHHDMIGNLQLWKGKWASCRYLEGEFMQNICSTVHAEVRVSMSESNFCGMEDNLAETPDSCSWGSSDLLYDSENQNSGMARGESRRNGLNRSFVDSSNGMKWCSISKNGEKTMVDGAQYMSYVKISKEQHERFKNSLKHANGIHPSSLSNVLGMIDPLNVHPFERFEEEEKEKLHAYWIKLVTNDIHKGFISMRKRQTHQRELIHVLAREIEQKLPLEAPRDGEKRGAPLDKLAETFTVGEEGIQKLPSDANKFLEKMASEDLLHEQRDTEVVERTTETEDVKGFKSDCLFEDQRRDDSQIGGVVNVGRHIFSHNDNHQHIASTKNSHGCTVVTPASTATFHGHHKQQICSLDSYYQTNSMDFPGDKRSAELEEDSPVVLEYPRNLNHVDIPAVQEDPFSSASNVWSVHDTHGYYDSTAVNTEYVSARALSLGAQQYIHWQTVQMIGLENNQRTKDVEKNMSHVETGDIPFFSPFSNSDRSELLQSIVKDQSNVQCVLGNELMVDRGKLSGEMEKVLPDLYLRENVYSGGCFSTPRRDNQPEPLNNQDWGGGVRMTMPSITNGGVMGEEGGVACDRNGWASFDGGGGSNSLYSVISECNESRPAMNQSSGGGLFAAGGWIGMGMEARFLSSWNK